MAPGKSRLVVASARDSYVRGLNAWSDGSKEGLDSAVEYFSRATELDPAYAEAYAGLADAYVMLGYFGYHPSDVMFPKAKQAALRSMRIDSTLASPHPALAYELAWERDFAGANSEFRKAVALDPTYATAKAIAVDPMYVTEHQWYAILLMILGDKPQVAEDLRAANRNAFSVNVPIVEITFTKWITAYPALAGYTSYGPGTIAGNTGPGVPCPLRWRGPCGVGGGEGDERRRGLQAALRAGLHGLHAGFFARFSLPGRIGPAPAHSATGVAPLEGAGRLRRYRRRTHGHLHRR